MVLLSRTITPVCRRGGSKGYSLNVRYALLNDSSVRMWTIAISVYVVLTILVSCGCGVSAISTQRDNHVRIPTIVIRNRIGRLIDIDCSRREKWYSKTDGMQFVTYWRHLLTRVPKESAHTLAQESIRMLIKSEYTRYAKSKCLKRYDLYHKEVSLKFY